MTQVINVLFPISRHFRLSFYFFLSSTTLLTLFFKPVLTVFVSLKQLQYSITYSWLYRLIAEISASAVIVHKPTPSPISISSIAFTSSSTTASVNCAVRRTAALGGYCCLRNPCSSGSDGDRSSSRATIASFQVRRREAARRAAAVAYGLPSLAGPTTSKAGNRSSLSTDGSSSNSSAI